MVDDTGTGLQDGMLAYYLSQAKLSDVNVEARIEKEPFDYRDHAGDAATPPASVVNRGS